MNGGSCRLKESAGRRRKGGAKPGHHRVGPVVWQFFSIFGREQAFWKMSLTSQPLNLARERTLCKNSEKFGSLVRFRDEVRQAWMASLGWGI